MRAFLLLTLLSLALALPAITRKGAKLYTPDGNVFYVKGVDYQPRGQNQDPLADIKGLKRDIPYLTNLGANAIRVYSSDINNNHDEGMALLEAAGIYVMFDATEPAHSINAAAGAWNLDIFSGIQAKIAHFAPYPNVFAFLAGNEVVNSDSDNIAAPFIKASVRDVKTYLKALGHNQLVGYAATDISANDNLLPYLECDDSDSSVDFYGINTYRWCNGDTYATSGYANYAGPYAVPLIFTEYGCNRVVPREFGEVAAIYGSAMKDSMSGAFAYEYSQEVNGYGLVQISTDGSSVTVLQDYTNLQTQLSKVVTPTTDGVSRAVVEQCPAKSTLFPVTPLPLPPTPDSAACDCMYNSLSCVVDSSATPTAIQGAVSTACAGAGVSCAPIVASTSTASYGAWSMCTAIQQSSYALNAYYSQYKSSQGAQACSFGGVGQVVTANPCAGGTPTAGGSDVAPETVFVLPTQASTTGSSTTGAVSTSTTGSSTGNSTTASNTSGSTTGSSTTGSSTTGSSTTGAKTASTGSSSSTTGTPTAVQTVNRYQTDYDAAFSAAAVNLPTLVVAVVGLLLVVV